MSQGLCPQRSVVFKTLQSAELAAAASWPQPQSQSESCPKPALVGLAGMRLSLDSVCLDIVFAHKMH